jgi:hypothetical protein
MTSLKTLRGLGIGAEPPLASKRRVYDGVLASLPAVPTLEQASTPHPPAPSFVAGLGSARALAIAAGIWLFGGATGAILYGAWRAPQVRVVYVDRPIAASPVATPVPSAALPQASATSARFGSVALPSSRGPAAWAPAASASSDLARERALLDLARAHAAHGEPSLVLEQVERHLQQFPRGRLAEEREALAIRALLTLKRTDEARARAQVFRISYPNSFLAPVLDSAFATP